MQAAPPISALIWSILAAGLIDIPPLKYMFLYSVPTCASNGPHHEKTCLRGLTK